MGIDIIFYSEHKLERTKIINLDKALNQNFPLGIGVGNKTFYQKEIEKYGGELWSWELPPTDNNLRDMASNIWGPEGISLHISENILITHCTVSWQEFLQDNKNGIIYTTIASTTNPLVKLIIAAPDYSLEILQEHACVENIEQLVNILIENDIEFAKVNKV